MDTELLKGNKMGHAPMLKLILTMSLPAMFSMLVQALYNVVDSIFLSWYSENALIAVSLAFPLQMIVISFGVGTGIGINSLVARRLGEKRKEEANSAATHGLFLGIFNWIVIAILGLLISRPFFEMFSSDANTIVMACNYMYIISIFSFGIFLQINCEKTLQATGNMIYPMIFQLIGALVNIILDPIMIFGYFGFPELGINGAAIATVIGQIVAMLFSIYVMFFKKHEVKITLQNFKWDFKTIKNIYQVGFPAIIMQSIGSVLIMGMNGILTSFSETAVAVLGVYFRLQSFVFMPVFGLTQGIMPIMGYNYGARNKERLMSATKIGVIIAVSIMAVGTLIFWVFTEPLLMIFNASDELMSMGVHALRIISIGFVMAAIGITISTFFQALGMGNTSLLISVLRQLFIILPLAYFLAGLGINYVWYSFVIAELIAMLLSIFLFKKAYNKRVAIFNHHEGSDNVLSEH